MSESPDCASCENPITSEYCLIFYDTLLICDNCADSDVQLEAIARAEMQHDFDTRPPQQMELMKYSKRSAAAGIISGLTAANLDMAHKRIACTAPLML